MNRIDYFEKFIKEKVEGAGKSGGIIGTSGGIDSTVCLYLTVRALGHSMTYALFLPYRDEHLEQEKYIRSMCEDLKVKFVIYDLKDIVSKFIKQTGCRDEVLIGNFAARLRTAYLYQYAARTNSLVINTANRTEIMTGYCTKWGDQAGDISPIGNLYKTEVSEIGKILEIPQNILNAVPSAGFYAGQEDEKELGISYEELDKILHLIDSSKEETADPDNLRKVKKLIKYSEHKRHLPCSP